MKAIVVLVLIANYVILENKVEEEIRKLGDLKYFVHHLSHGNVGDDEVVKDCFEVPFELPTNLSFKGSKYLFKLLRTAYFHDLRSENVGSPKPNSVFQQALSSYKYDLRAAPPLSHDQSDGINSYDNLPPSQKCEIKPSDIYRLIIKKISKNCVFAEGNGVHFTVADLNGVENVTGVCPEMLNKIMNKIIYDFKQITSDNQIEIHPYTEALKFMFLTNANDLTQGFKGAKMSKLRLLLLNEFVLIKMSSKET